MVQIGTLVDDPKTERGKEIRSGRGVIERPEGIKGCGVGAMHRIAGGRDYEKKRRNLKCGVVIPSVVIDNVYRD